VYPPGVGIMPHFDGPLYTSKVVVLSLGGPSIISFTDNYNNVNKLARLFLEDHSIHIFEGEAYKNCLHGIENYSIDCIFLNVVFEEDDLIRISKASVDNFHLTKLSKVVLEVLRLNNQSHLQKL
jgi:alkylated DNA repair protein alkB family protein 6